MNIEEVYLKTAFCCMACDGSIADEEIQVLRRFVKETDLFSGIDSQGIINRYVQEINIQGSHYLKAFLKEISEAELKEPEELTVIKLALETIKADNQVVYSEVSFFKKIRSRLNVSDEAIRDSIEVEDLFLNQDIIDDEEIDFTSAFSEIKLSVV